MAKKRKGDHHFSSWGPDYDIDTSFGGIDNKYSNASIPEGIELLKGDLKDLAAEYWRNTQLEENQVFKLPPLPLSLLRYLRKPIKGLYEADKKATLGASLLKTVAGDSSRRGFLKTIVGNSDKLRNARILKKMIEDSKKIKSKFKFEDLSKGSKAYKKMEKEIAEIFSKHSTKHAEGGVIEEVWDKKGIEKAKESLKGMKPHLMEESYIQLLDFLDSKQKELDMDIMESAGGLGEMLGEGGVAGHSPLAVEQLPSQRRKKHIPHEFPKLYEGRSEGGRIGMMYGGDPGFAFSYGGSWADWKDNHASEMPLMDYIYQKLPKARHPFSDAKYNSGGPVHELDGLALSIFQKPYAQLTSYEQSALDNFKHEAYEPIPKAEGGRIGMAEGDTPSEAYLRDLYYDGGWDDRGDIGLHEFMHGPIGANEWFKHINKAEGGRIGFQEGTGIMSQTGIPYYADKAVEGIVHSAETLSKLPFAGGELISKLLRQKPNKKMFSEALENITPGSWAKNLGISSLAEAEGAKVSDKQRAIGDVLGLGTEMAVPVGVAFKTGQNLINQASKVFGKLKKGKTLDQTINDTITDFGQSRRDFNILAGTSGLMVALKAIGLGGLLKGASKKVDDIKVTFKSDADYSYEGPESGWEGGNWTNISFEPLTKIGQKILDNIYQLGSKKGEGILPTREAVDEYAKFGAHADTTGYGTDAIEVIKKIKKAKGNIQVETFKPGNLKNNTLGELESIIFKGDDINFKNIMDKSDDLLTDTHYGNPRMVPSDQELEFVIDALKTKKAEGGRIGAAAGRFIDSVGIGPLNINPRMGITETEKPLGPDVDKKIGTTNIGADIMLDLPKDFYLKGEYDKNRASEDIYYQGEKVLEDVPFDHDIWKYGAGIEKEGFRAEVIYNPENERYEFKLVKSFNDGGKVWRPKSAPKLTTTIPPERGPTPQGLTYLTGDDIVQNIG